MWPLPSGLSSTQTEPLNQRSVPFDIHLRQVVQQPAATADQQQQTPPRVVVMLVHLEMLCQVTDPLRQHRDLGLWPTGIRVMQPILGQNRLLLLSGQRHSYSPMFSCRVVPSRG